MPPTLYLQADNCWRENKNKFVLAFCEYLVHEKIFKEVSTIYTWSNPRPDRKKPPRNIQRRILYFVVFIEITNIIKCSYVSSFFPNYGTLA